MPSRFASPPDVSNLPSGEFSISTNRKTGWVTIAYQLSAERYSALDELDPEELADAGVDARDRTAVKLLKAHPKKDELIIFPLNTLPGDNFLKPKYERTETIILEGFGLGCPNSPDEVDYLLEGLPSGFVKDPEYGLGLRKEYRFIINAIEKIPGVRHLCLSRTRKTDVKDNTYILNFRQYDAIRKAINNTHRNAVAKAAAEKRILVHNSLLHGIDDATYPEQKQTYTDGTIYKVIEGEANPELSEKDQLAALTLVKQSEKSLGKKHPEKLLQLQREIELVTLEQLIERMASLVNKRLAEKTWQKFFLDYPFVLSL